MLALVSVACGSATSLPGTGAAADGATFPQAAAIGARVGDPCTPALENEPSFRGFDERDVNL